MDTAPAYTIFVTQTLKHKVQCTSIAQIKELIKLIHNIINPMGKYLLCPECHLDGSIHFHFVIQVKDWIKYYKTINRLESIGYYKPEKIKVLADVLKYIKKDNSIMESILGIKLPLDNISTKVYAAAWKVEKAKRYTTTWEPELDGEAYDIDTVCVPYYTSQIKNTKTENKDIELIFSGITL